MAVRPDRDWDFFVSYAQADRAWAEWIAWILEEELHYRVLIQAWDFVPGSNWVQSIQDGITWAERTVAVLSEAYLESVYGAAEWQAAWRADSAGAERKLVPVRVGECNRPGLLGGVVGIDLLGVDETIADARLRDAIAQAVSGRAKPSVKPLFPPSIRAMPRQARFPGALPSVWRVPARNPNFTGREEDLVHMRQAIEAGSRVTVHSIHGMGGVGKTRLAVEYAWAQAGSYDLVWLIIAEKSAAIPDQFTSLARSLGLEPEVESEALQMQVHGALRRLPGWLLIFDNVDEISTIKPWLPVVPLPPGTPGHVILTTRRGGFGELGEVFDVDVLDPEAAVDLMSARVHNIDRAVAAEIATELGWLPLALEQAAAFIDVSEMSAADYLALLKTRTAEMLGRGRVAGRDATAASVWNLSFERLEQRNPAALQLLDVCAYLAPEAIPLDLFSGQPDLLPSSLAGAAADTLALNDTVAALVDYSLAKRTPSGLQLHRLVQAALRARHMRASRAASVAAEPRTKQQPDSHDGFESLLTALRLLRADLPETIYGVPEAWRRWAALLPHVLTATRHADDLAVGSTGGLATMTARLLDRAATYLQVHARLAEARPLAERALAIDEANYGPDHPNVGTDLNTLAWILQDLGDTAAARPLMERALAIDEAAYGSDHPKVAGDLNHLARILFDLRDHAAARPLLERALVIDRATYGPDHLTVGTDMSILSRILYGLGDPDAARPLMERALAIDETAYGPDKPEIATRLGNLASVLRDLGDPAAARPLAESALAIDEAAYGPDHPKVAYRLNSLATILADLRDPADARPLTERALRIAEASYGPDHPRLAWIRATLDHLSPNPLAG
jgi:tetratricopeptide (TPR) repeat protein